VVQIHPLTPWNCEHGASFISATLQTQRPATVSTDSLPISKRDRRWITYEQQSEGEDEAAPRPSGGDASAAAADEDEDSEDELTPAELKRQAELRRQSAADGTGAGVAAAAPSAAHMRQRKRKVSGGSSAAQPPTKRARVKVSKNASKLQTQKAYYRCCKQTVANSEPDPADPKGQIKARILFRQLVAWIVARRGRASLFACQ
jgi:hypothetical protein